MSATKACVRRLLRKKYPGMAERIHYLNDVLVDITMCFFFQHGELDSFTSVV